MRGFAPAAGRRLACFVRLRWRMREGVCEQYGADRGDSPGRANNLTYSFLYSSSSSADEQRVLPYGESAVRYQGVFA